MTEFKVGDLVGLGSRVYNRNIGIVCEIRDVAGVSRYRIVWSRDPKGYTISSANYLYSIGIRKLIVRT